ncbi:MAG: peptidyl-prolyl cis-trans isomerase [Lentisphaeria bacterium]|nr:peptidyl-prolyl cis-trans isomerase [Lentisphaeria bacterium]
MYSPKYFLFLFFTFLVSGLFFSSFCVNGGEKNVRQKVRDMRVDSVLVSVNGQGITLLDVLLETNSDEIRLANMYSGERLYSETEKLRRKVIEEIIIRKLVFEEYKRRPFPIEKQHIDRYMDLLAFTMGNGTRLGLEKKARSLGTSLDALRDKIREKIAVDVLLHEFCDRPIYVTPKEVFEYYKNNPRSWTEPEKYSLELLLVAKNSTRNTGTPEEVCAKIKKELDRVPKTEDFSSLVRAYSDAPGAENNQKPSIVEKDKLRPEFTPFLAKGKPGDILGPVETLEGYYFILLHEIIPEKKIPFEEVSEKIRLLLEEAQRRKVRSEYAGQLKAGAVIKYYY